jgi:hypothetical protein
MILSENLIMCLLGETVAQAATILILVTRFLFAGTLRQKR